MYTTVLNPIFFRDLQFFRDLNYLFELNFVHAFPMSIEAFFHHQFFLFLEKGFPDRFSVFSKVTGYAWDFSEIGTGTRKNPILYDLVVLVGKKGKISSKKIQNTFSDVKSNFQIAIQNANIMYYRVFFFEKCLVFCKLKVLYGQFLTGLGHQKPFLFFRF